MLGCVLKLTVQVLEHRFEAWTELATSTFTFLALLLSDVMVKRRLAEIACLAGCFELGFFSVGTLGNDLFETLDFVVRLKCWVDAGS